MKVALTYCGGCDPAYDRVEFFKRIRAAAGDAVEWVGLDDPDHEAVLLVCGCPRACPAGELSLARPVICLKDEQTPPEEVTRLILDRGKT